MTKEKDDIINKLQQEVLKFRTRNTQKVASDKIKFFGLDDKGKNFAVECNILDSSNTAKSRCVVFGRPPIADSATKQQRHITPYKFLELVIDKYTTNLSCPTVEKAQEILLELKPSLKTLVSFTPLGLCFTNEDFMHLREKIKADQKQDVQTWIHITTELNLDNRDYYLVHKDISELITKTCSKQELSNANSLYQDKMTKLLDYTIDELHHDIISCDSVIIINQSLIKLALILFNTRPNISLPNDKWHTLDYSIRLYKTQYGAENNENTGFTTVTSDKLYNMWHQEHHIMGKIRIVKDEGALVKATIESLKKISEIIQLLSEKLYFDAKQQINDYNRLLQERKVLQEYSKKLNIENTTDDVKIESMVQKLYSNNIPCHLYHIFDFKPLEQKVFVRSDLKLHNSTSPIDVYDTGGPVQYCFTSSTNYRGNKNPNPLRRDEKFVVQKVVDHVVTSILAFFNFTHDDKRVHSNNYKLLEAFSKKITDQSKKYSFDKEKYQTEINNYYKTYDMFHHVVSSEDDTTSHIIGVSEQLN